jgi:hypothetical protein
MEDPLITEYAGTRRGEISRFYQYGSGGVRVLDPRKTVKRVYLFDPDSEIMTERDPLRREKVLRRFVFDRFGMTEETFAFGERPRTFRFENGGKQIAVREGGDYGAVGKLITFEENGVTETAWGRNGEIERVYQFDAKGDLVTIREGGWYGDVSRTIVFSRNRASLFREPESFLQFFVFTEWSVKDREDQVSDSVARIRGERADQGRSPGSPAGRRAGQAGAARQDPVNRKTSRDTASDTGIDFIPDDDGPARQGPPMRRSAAVSFTERRQGDRDDSGGFRRGWSAEIPLDERFGSREPGTLSRGRSAEIPLDERFGSREPGTLSRGRSAEIPLDERFGTSRITETQPPGKGAEIPPDERDSTTELQREKISKGKSPQSRDGRRRASRDL